MTPISRKSLGERMKALRTERGFSQEDIAKALGIHRQSISLIEQGERDLTATELDALTRFLQVSFDDVLAPSVRAKKETRAERKLFQPAKLQQLLLAVLKEVGGRPNIGETVLYKLLYFCDFDHYERTGKPITGLVYRRLQFGPVPQRREFEKVINDMLEQRELQKIMHEYHGLPQVRYIPLRDPDPEVLSEDELSTIYNVLEKLGHMNARQIEEYVHGDAPWEATKHQEPIDYTLVAWRSAPYAATSEEERDRALEQAQFTDVEKDLEPMTKEEYNYYMTLPSLPDA